MDEPGSHAATRGLGDDGRVQIERFNETRLQRQRLLLIGRLQRLQRLGLADEMQPGTWAVHADAEKTLRALGERGDIIRTMQRAMRGEPRELAVFEPGDDGNERILGRVAAEGWPTNCATGAIWSSTAWTARPTTSRSTPATSWRTIPTGAVVEVKGSADVRAADSNIAALASDGLYRTDHHLAVAQGQAVPGPRSAGSRRGHVRRLEALRRAGIVERVAEGLWKVPDDLPEQGRRYDAQRLGGVAVELKSHLPIERQARVIRGHLARPAVDRRRLGAGRPGLWRRGQSRRCSSAPTSWPNRGLAERRRPARDPRRAICWARCAIGEAGAGREGHCRRNRDWSIGLVADGQRVAGYLPALASCSPAGATRCSMTGIGIQPGAVESR